jgi:hypothetical protein
VWSHLSFAAAWLLPWVGLWTLVVIGICGWHFALYFARPAPQRRALLRSRVVSTVVMLLLVGSMAHGLYFLFSRTRARFEPVIKALDAYRQRSGVYPSGLPALVPTDLSTVPPCVGGKKAYYSLRDDGTYYLACTTFPFYTYSFNLKFGRWRGMD